MSWRKNDKSRTPSILCEGGLCVCVCKSAALTGRQLVDVGSHAISSRPWSGYLSLPTFRSGNESSSFAMDQRTPTARLASGKRIPHRFGYLFPTNSRMDHQQYGILPIWHHAQMTSSPPKPRAKKTPNTTRQASAQFSLCNRLQPPTLAHLTATSFRKGRNSRYHSVHARRSRAHQTSFLVPSTVLLVLSSALAGTARTGWCKKKREGASNMV